MVEKQDGSSDNVQGSVPARTGLSDFVVCRVLLMCVDLKIIVVTV